MPYYLSIALGSALGGLARFWLGAEIARYFGSLFPYGTLTINILGSLLIGAASNYIQINSVRFFLMIGFCGGFTTFSTFSLESINLLRQGAYLRAALYVLASVVLCLAAAAAGTRLRW